MIDWLSLIFNSIWILGAALSLAVLNLAYFQARSRGEKVSKILYTPNVSLSLNIAGALFCIGLGLTSDRWWEIALWVLLFVGFGYQSYATVKRGTKY